MRWVPLRCGASQQRATFIGSALLWSVNAQQMFEITSVNSSLKTWQAERIYSSPPFPNRLFLVRDVKRWLGSLLTSAARTCHVISACVYQSTLWIVATSWGAYVCTSLIKPRPPQNTNSPDTQWLFYHVSHEALVKWCISLMNSDQHLSVSKDLRVYGRRAGCIKLHQKSEVQSRADEYFNRHGISWHVQGFITDNSNSGTTPSGKKTHTQESVISNRGSGLLIHPSATLCYHPALHVCSSRCLLERAEGA